MASLKAVLAPTLDDKANDESRRRASSAPEMESAAPGADIEPPLGCKLSVEELARRWRQYERTDQLVRRFMLNEGPQLQRDLKEYANKCQNWVSTGR